MRRHYLDNIRWMAVVLVLVYHVAYLFNHVGILGGVAPLPGGEWVDVFGMLPYPWFMALLFLVAGMSTRYALEKRSCRQFLAERARKLLVPSTLGLFVLHWVTGYWNVRLGGGAEYIPGFLRYPVYALSGIGPLWFVQMLFLFSLLGLLVKQVDRDEKCYRLCGKCRLLVLLVVPVWGAAQVGNLPVFTMYRFGIYGMCYLLGYLVFSHDEVIERLEKAKLPLLGAGLVLGAVFGFRYYGEDYTAPGCLQGLLANLYLWAMVLAILGCAKAWLDFTTPVFTYCAGASFGWYVLHYPVVLCVACLLAEWGKLPTAAVYLAVLVLELGITAGLYEAVKRMPVVRFAVLGRKGQRGSSKK